MAAYKGFAFAPEAYNPESVRAGAHTAKEYRKEYQRLYRVAQKRLRSFERAGRTDNATYRYNIERLRPSTELNERELASAMQDMHRFLASARGSVSGQRRYEREQIELLNERGLDFVNASNFKQFTEFMEEARQRKLDNLQGSDRVALLFGAMVEAGRNPSELYEDFDFWAENRKKLEDELRKNPDVSLDELRKKII